MLINILAFAIGFYCLLESISAAADMHKGDRLCRLAKYLFAGSSGFYVMLIAMHGYVSIGLLLLIASVALGIWPRMVSRITKHGLDAAHLKKRMGL